MIAYYGFLARRIAPQRVFAVAALRAVRRARNLLAPPLEPAVDRLLATLGCEGPAALGSLLARPRPARAPWTAVALRRALDRRIPGEAEIALARAETIAGGRLLVYGRWVDARRAGGGIDWQRDPIGGGRFDRPPRAPGLDPKMVWSLARGEAWVALACGAVLDPRGGKALAAALTEQVVDFVRQNPVGQGVHWASAMEAALRAYNLVVALWVLSIRRAPPAPELALAAARLLVATGRFVLAHLEDDTAVPNNHLTADWLGLLACAAGLPEWPEAPRWRLLALAGLRQAIVEQVLPDGTSFEGSVPYHRFSLELFTAGAILAHASRCGLGRGYAARLHGMFAVARALVASSGDLPQLGDNDSGHALSVRQRGPTEGGYLLPLGAALFRDGTLLVRAGAADAAEVVWFLGPRALAWLGRARPGPPPRSAAFPRGGFHALRRGPLEAFVCCGPSGQRGIGGHNHNDKLALELRVGGRLAICDPGTPAYGGNRALRNRFRSTRAHATITVDGLEQAPLPADRLFALPDLAGARLLALVPSPRADHLAGEHRGYKGRIGIVHRRDVWAAEEGLAVLDRLEGAGTHAVELRWPIASTAPRVRRVRAEERPALERLAALADLRHEIDLSRAVEVPLGAVGRLLLAFACPAGLAAEVGAAPRSPGYAELVDGAVVLLAGRVACPAALGTLMLYIPE